MRSISFLLSALFLVTLLVACEQNPDHLTAGEDDPAYRHGANHNPYADDVKLAGMIGRGKMPRAEDPRDQNILVEVRWVEADHEWNQRAAAGVRYANEDNSRFLTVNDDELFEANGLSLTVFDARRQFPSFSTELNNRETRVKANMVTVLNRRRGAIALLNEQPSGPIVLRTPGGNVVADSRAVTGARLIVEPEIVDTEREIVRVKVWPELAGMRADGSIDTSIIQSEAVVPNGGMLLIGGNTEVNGSLGAEILAKRVGNERKNLLILLTIRY